MLGGLQYELVGGTPGYRDIGGAKCANADCFDGKSRVVTVRERASRWSKEITMKQSEIERRRNTVILAGLAVMTCVGTMVLRSAVCSKPDREMMVSTNPFLDEKSESGTEHPRTAPTSLPAWLSGKVALGERTWQKELQEVDTLSLSASEWESFIKEPAALELARKVRKLVISEPHFAEKAVASLNKYPQITALSIKSRRLTADDLRGLGQLRHLTAIGLWVYKLTDDEVAPLLKVPSLKSLELGGCDKCTGAALRLCPSIERLAITGPGLTEEGLASLRKLRRLKEVVLPGVRTHEGVLPTDKVVGYLKGNVDLHIVELGGNRVSDDGLASLGGMLKLDTLKVRSPRITNRGLAHCASLTSMRIMHLSGTSIDGNGLLHLVRFPYLEDLDVSSTYVDDNAMSVISRMKMLRRLDLSHTFVSDVGVRCLTGMPRLETISLICTVVTDASLETLGKLQGLKGVRLYGTRVLVNDTALTYQLPGNKAEVLDYMDLGVGYDRRQGLIEQRGPDTRRADGTTDDPAK
jgi:hypothetical protein